MFAKKYIFYLKKLVNGEVDDTPELSSTINPELTRELLLTAVRLLERDANMKTKRSISSDEPLPSISPPLTKPCKKSDEDEKLKGKGRRSIGTAINPYTGQLHYVAYPNYYYPTVYG